MTGNGGGYKELITLKRWLFRCSKFLQVAEFKLQAVQSCIWSDTFLLWREPFIAAGLFRAQRLDEGLVKSRVEPAIIRLDFFKQRVIVGGLGIIEIKCLDIKGNLWGQIYFPI